MSDTPFARLDGTLSDIYQDNLKHKVTVPVIIREIKKFLISLESMTTEQRQKTYDKYFTAMAEFFDEKDPANVEYWWFDNIIPLAGRAGYVAVIDTVRHGKMTKIVTKTYTLWMS